MSTVSPGRILAEQFGAYGRLPGRLTFLGLVSVNAHVRTHLAWSQSRRGQNHLDEKSPSRRVRADDTPVQQRVGRFTSSWRAVPSPDAGRLRGSNLPHAGFWTPCQVSERVTFDSLRVGAKFLHSISGSPPALRTHNCQRKSISDRRAAALPQREHRRTRYSTLRR